MKYYMEHVTDEENDCYVADKSMFSLGDTLLRELGYTQKTISLENDIVVRERFVDSKNYHEICFNLSAKEVDCSCAGPMTRELMHAVDVKRNEFDWI